jgi:hypothetical protein
MAFKERHSLTIFRCHQPSGNTRGVRATYDCVGTIESYEQFLRVDKHSFAPFLASYTTTDRAGVNKHGNLKTIDCDLPQSAQIIGA